jgi:SNF2 family DNA or RNA helicase
VFVGNIRAAGTGLTLTAASDLILFESDWAPAANAQAIKRIHRIGQKNECRARFITLANSIDEMVTKTVVSKTAAIAASGYEMTAA